MSKALKATRDSKPAIETGREILPGAIPVRPFRDNHSALTKLHNRTHISLTALIRMAIDLGVPSLEQKLEANGEHPTNGRRAV